jgi:hypothetical protein
LSTSHPLLSTAGTPALFPITDFLPYDNRGLFKRSRRAQEVVHGRPGTPGDPGRWVYALSAGLLVAAIVVASIIVVGLVRSAEDIQQMVAPGEATMELDATGTHGVFYERDTDFQGQSLSGPEALPALDLVLVNAAYPGRP